MRLRSHVSSPQLERSPHPARGLRDAHMRHHFHNENYNWGITNGLGDVLLGTWKGTSDVEKSATAKKLSGFEG